jgi:hypothetical protein
MENSWACFLTTLFTVGNIDKATADAKSVGHGATEAGLGGG